jgi:hypothetical protein
MPHSLQAEHLHGSRLHSMPECNSLLAAKNQDAAQRRTLASSQEVRAEMAKWATLMVTPQL